MIDKEGYKYNDTPFEITTALLILVLIAIVIFAFIGGVWVISTLLKVSMIIGTMIMCLLIFGVTVYFTKFI